MALQRSGAESALDRMLLYASKSPPRRAVDRAPEADAGVFLVCPLHANVSRVYDGRATERELQRRANVFAERGHWLGGEFAKLGGKQFVRLDAVHGWAQRPALSGPG